MGQDQSTENAGNKTLVTDGVTKGKASLNDIIVVSKKKSEKSSVTTDCDLYSIKKLSITKPLIHGIETSSFMLPHVPTTPFTEMVLRYQIYLTECAESISIDQTTLAKRIKDVDALSSSLLKKVNERQKIIESAASQFSMIDDLVLVTRNIDLKLHSAMALSEQITEQLQKIEQSD